MHPHSTVQAWLHGGPADGAIQQVACQPDGRPPELLMLAGGGQVFVGSSDQPATAEHPMYELEPDAEPIEDLWPYRYVATLPAD